MENIRINNLKIKSAIVEANLTQTDVAEALNCSRQHVNNICTGKSKDLSSKELFVISKLTKKPMEFFCSIEN